MVGARLTLALAAASALAHVGCNTSCDTSDEGNQPELYTGGTADPANATYESSPSTSGVLPFPGGKQYFLAHHLGFTPTYPDISVGFAADGQGLAPCTGNTCIVRCVNSEFIWLQNDTCADFFVRVVTTKRSNFQQGTLCPGGASISVIGTPDASIEAPTAPPDSSDAQDTLVIPDAANADDAVPAE